MIDSKQKEKWMFLALSEAKKAEKMDEVPIGAIIVKDNAIIGRGFNQMESLKDSTAHAEIIAITSASNTIGDWRLNKCSLYVTKEPCLMCIGAILNSRIENLYYGMSDKENGYITTKKFINNSVHLKSIEGSILEFDSKKIIQDFFLNKR
tara:strand:+ start:39 stop:488 length:450 start_codon:yes stop_codon:yes gene_type:complete